MKILQKTIGMLVAPATLERIRSETNQWQVRCLGCGATRPLWEAGGIRYRKSATSNITITFAECHGCGKLRKAVVEPATEPSETGLAEIPPD